MWRYIVLPIIQTKSLKDPVVHFPPGDYTSYSRYEVSQKSPPDHLKPYIENSNEVFTASDVKKIIMEDITFSDSKNFRGLQLIDILVTNVRRAFQGNLRLEGWRNIGKLMLQPKEDQMLYE